MRRPRETVNELRAEVQRLKARVDTLEAMIPKHYPPIDDFQTVDWRRYPPLLNAHHLADIYAYSLRTVRNMLASRSAKLPTPCQARPFKVRKADCKRHFGRMSA